MVSNVAIICGAIFPIQSGLNKRLTKNTLNPIITTFFSVMIGFLTILLYDLIIKQEFPTIAKLKEVSW